MVPGARPLATALPGLCQFAARSEAVATGTAGAGAVLLAAVRALARADGRGSAHLAPGAIYALASWLARASATMTATMSVAGHCAQVCLGQARPLTVCEATPALVLLQSPDPAGVTVWLD